MKNSSTPANKTDRLVQFRFQDAQRIASVVHEVESSRRDRNPSQLPRAFSGGGGSLKVCQFSGAWPKGTDKIVTIVSSSDFATTATISSSTTSVKNFLFDSVGSCDGGNKKAVIGTDGGIWFLISPEC